MINMLHCVEITTGKAFHANTELYSFHFHIEPLKQNFFAGHRNQYSCCTLLNRPNHQNKKKTESQEVSFSK